MHEKCRISWVELTVCICILRDFLLTCFEERIKNKREKKIKNLFFKGRNIEQSRNHHRHIIRFPTFLRSTTAKCFIQEEMKWHLRKKKRKRKRKSFISSFGSCFKKILRRWRTEKFLPLSFLFSFFFLISKLHRTILEKKKFLKRKQVENSRYEYQISMCSYHGMLLLYFKLQDFYLNINEVIKRREKSFCIRKWVLKSWNEFKQSWFEDIIFNFLQAKFDHRDERRTLNHFMTI